MSTSSTPDRAQAARPIDCEAAVRRLWDFLDGRLPTIARDEVEAHLATCLACPPHFTFARAMQSALAGLCASDEEAAMVAARDALRTRVREALRRRYVPPYHS